MAVWPNLAAHPSGVEQMSSSRASRSAPCSMKSAAFSTSPFRANWCSGVMRSQSGWLGFIPRLNRSSFDSRVLAPTDHEGNVTRLAKQAGSAAANGQRLHSLVPRRWPVPPDHWREPGWPQRLPPPSAHRRSRPAAAPFGQRHTSRAAQSSVGRSSQAPGSKRPPNFRPQDSGKRHAQAAAWRSHNAH